MDRYSPPTPSRLRESMSRHTRAGEAPRRGRCEMSHGRECWRGVLLAGAFTALPRWTLEPVPGVGEHETRIPDELVAALRRLTHELNVRFSSVLLTAHAKVLGGSRASAMSRRYFTIALNELHG